VGSAPVDASVDASTVGSIRADIVAPAIAVCRKCGLGWQPRPPTARSLEEAYAGLADRTYVAEEANRIRTAALAAWLVARSGAPAGGAVLDVGCSAGYFVEAALRRGFDARGLEPSEWLCERARARVGADRVVHATFEKAPLRPASFDVVTMWDVLEHAIDPVAFLARAREALRPGGLVVLDVPARDTWTARLLGPRWPLLLPEHLFYFSRASLRIALEAAGFEAPRFRPHIVFFSIGYVAHRLAQHDLGLVGSVAERLAGSDVPVPLVMGERTAIARAR
jgi:SAM-dependent methyltransferase